MVIAFAFVAFILLVFIFYIFFLIRPRWKPRNLDNLQTDYAHRGLHGDGRPENSLSAFSEAVKNGVGIELDLQLSSDGIVMVFHDDTLERMTGIDRKLSETDSEFLKEVSFLGSCERIPSLTEVLQLVDGKVPLLIELKGTTLNSNLCKKASEILKNYHGPFCVESFNPFLIHSMKRYLPQVPYGQLYTFLFTKDNRTFRNLLLSYMAFNFLSRPDFIAYQKNDRNRLPVRITTNFFKAKKFVWTVNSNDEFDFAGKIGESRIFELLEK